MTKGFGVWAFGLWASAAVVGGAVMTSFHGSFRAPSAVVLRLARGDGGHAWRAVHFVSRGCAGSQKVMIHLARRGPIKDLVEEVVAIDGPEPPLAGSRELLARLSAEGFLVEHVDERSIPGDARLTGVPLLVVATPQNRIAYSGGYGSSGAEDVETIRLAREGGKPDKNPVEGCELDATLRQTATPFSWKN